MSVNIISKNHSIQTNGHLTEKDTDISDNDIHSFCLNVTDFFDFEHYFDLLIKSLHGKKLSIATTAIDLWRFYFKSDIYKTIELLLIEKDPVLLETINNYFKKLLIVVLISYDASFNPLMLKAILSLLNQSLIKLHHVVLLLFDYLLKYCSLSIDSLTTKDIISLINAKLSMKTDNHSQKIINIITLTTALIDKLIIQYASTQFGIEIKLFWLNFDTISHDDINLFFQGEIIRKSFIDYKEAPVCIHMPKSDLPISRENQIELNYYKQKENKYYTLVLDLDETLIHFKLEKVNEGKVQFRPYLFQFLENISKYYEIVVFTAGIKEYADAVLDIIEKKIGKKVFNKRLYRQHTFFLRGAYLKDLNIIGRDLEKVLIVDNISDNFQCQKDNGIEIFPYLGNDHNDKCLRDLEDILYRISNNRKDSIKKQIKEYSQEIKEKVTKK